jgi:membrane protein implicated in regulation of membrane protease activity
VLGELWLAQAGEVLQPGDRIQVRGREGLRLTVERKAGASQ